MGNQIFIFIQCHDKFISARVIGFIIQNTIIIRIVCLTQAEEVP
ncbi:MAG: hypothetical protein PG977_000434 [Bartonella clarridgeiae]|nr:MAG: hypothetical protein PG977_000434 [Bartonella clarridgeiae]